jgi:hypothetical protein
MVRAAEQVACPLLVGDRHVLGAQTWSQCLTSVSVG